MEKNLLGGKKNEKWWIICVNNVYDDIVLEYWKKVSGVPCEIREKNRI